jgi:hypothetical protein
VLSGQAFPEDAFGPWIYVLYLAHRRSTRKVNVFIE